MRSVTGSVYVCEGNSLEEVSMVTQFYSFVSTHSLIASDVQKVFRFDDRISFNPFPVEFKSLVPGQKSRVFSRDI